MRISDWSSDVCSSDLQARHDLQPFARTDADHGDRAQRGRIVLHARATSDDRGHPHREADGALTDMRSEERRVGKVGSVRVDLGGRRIIKKKQTLDKKTNTVNTLVQIKKY